MNGVKNHRNSAQGTTRLRRTFFVYGLWLSHTITAAFLQGVVVTFPIIIAAYALIWVVGLGESAARALFFAPLGEDFYVTGLGFTVLAAGILGVGLAMYWAQPRMFFNRADRLMRRVPIFGLIYSPTRDLMNVFNHDVGDTLGQVVVIEIPNTSIRMLGFITREDLSDFPEGLAMDDDVVVYVQWGYQIGGYCLIVPKSAIRPIDMSVEEGMRWALTAGVSGTSLSGSTLRKCDKF